MEIINKFIRRNRMYVTLTDGFKNETMAHSVYVWRKGNPSFRGIPKGYVIHHLDHDQLNDDISNLVLMYKHHHVAYHLKHIVCEVPVECNVAMSNREMGFDYPTRRPRVYCKNPSRNTGWRLAYYIPDKRNKTYLSRINGRPFQSREEAERAIDILWPNNNWVPVKPRKRANEATKENSNNSIAA
jgi:hypothetical protein